MAQGPLKALAKADLGDEARRVLFAVLAELDFENWININQSQLAAEIGLERQNFGRGLKKLINEEIVLEGPKVGRNGTYRLNPLFGWRGSAKGHVNALQERMKARGMSVVTGGSSEGSSSEEDQASHEEG